MKYLVILSLLLTFSVSAQQNGYYPQPLGFVNDFEGVFSAEEKKAIGDEVKDMLRRDVENDYPIGLEIAVVSVTDSMLGSEKSLNSYVAQLAKEWEMGKGEKDNSLIIALGKRIKQVTIIPGNDLKEILPADTCQKIVDEKIVPQLRRNRYADGVIDAIASLIRYLWLNKK